MKKYILCFLCAVLAFLTAFFNVFGSADTALTDILYHKPTGVNNKIRIIKIDEKTLNRYGEFTDWDRGIYADLVEALCVSEEVRPAVIGFDILFSSDMNEESDKRFAEACGKYDNVVTKIISAPGLWLQRITTKEPEDGMIEVAIAALKACEPENPDVDRSVDQKKETAEETKNSEEEAENNDNI